MNTTAIEQKEQTAQFVWTGFIVMFFIIQAIIWIVAISFTSRDPSHAVVAGYDEQALKWDEVKLMREASAALGWNCQIVVGDDSDVRGFRTLSIVLADKDNAPIENATVFIRAFHRGRAADVQELKFLETEPGVYASQIRLTKPGNWQFSGTASRQFDCYLVEAQEYVLVGGE